MGFLLKERCSFQFKTQADHKNAPKENEKGANEGTRSSYKLRI